MSNTSSLKVFDADAAAGGFQLQGRSSAIDGTFGLVAFDLAFHDDRKFGAHAASSARAAIEVAADIAKFHSAAGSASLDETVQRSDFNWTARSAQLDIHFLGGGDRYVEVYGRFVCC